MESPIYSEGQLIQTMNTIFVTAVAMFIIACIWLTCRTINRRSLKKEKAKQSDLFTEQPCFITNTDDGKVYEGTLRSFKSGKKAVKVGTEWYQGNNEGRLLRKSYGSEWIWWLP